MKEAIDHIALAQNNVSQITIQNCWNKTGILLSYDAHDDEMDDNVSIQDFEDEDEMKILLMNYQMMMKYENTFKSLIVKFQLKNILQKNKLLI